MRKIYLLVLLLLLSLSPRVHASHLYGGDLLYQHISGNTYRITVVLYGDCGSAQPGTFASLMYSTPEVYIFDAQNNVYETTLLLPIDSAQSDIDVTPVCPDEANNTACKGGSLPGIKKYVYHDTITLSHTSSNWQFAFTGLLIVGSGNNNGYAGRTNSITNIVFGTSQQIMYLLATLNNVNGPNSSPVYNTVPTPFYCVGVSQQYNQGATDPDLDSLTFALVPGLIAGNPTSYILPYSGTNPLSASNFSFNNLNGQMAFKPDMMQKALVVNEVREYKNGVLVGSSMREMTFIILDNCQNLPPDGNLLSTGSNFVGGIHDGNNVINACPEVPLISFDISPLDPDNLDTVILTGYNVPAGANLAIQNNNTPSPSVTFNWNTSTVAPGIYTFYINYKDDGCPLSSNQTIAYTVQIANPYVITADVLSETECQHRAAVRYNLYYGILPRTITVSQGGNIIKTLIDTLGTVLDSLAAGSYTIKVSSPFFPCDTSISLFIPDSGTYPTGPEIGDDLSFCIGDPTEQLPVTGAVNSILQWYDNQGNILQSAPIYTTNSAGDYLWYVSQKVNNCISDTSVVHLKINANPEIAILNKPGKICYADRIYLEATGGSSYVWSPVSQLVKDEQGKDYAFVTMPITYTVIGTDDNGCKDTAEIAFTEIEQCCSFGYPNAFTPNNDGKNDRFRPVMYGNMEEYEISIFNRFGEVVYHSKDASGGWDGKYKGQLCDVGMYYFKVKAKCYTGTVEEKSDALDLLR